jgi:integrase
VSSHADWNQRVTRSPVDILLTRSRVGGHVGSSRKRVNREGKVSYAALYRDLRGRQRSAGTFATEKQADRAWQRAEAMVEGGRHGDLRRGRQKLKQYVEDVWLPSHEIEVSTRERYTYTINKYLLPEFGAMRMIDILPEHVRDWITKLKADGLAASTIASNKTILSAIFTTALNDQVVFLHPCRGVKTPTVPRAARTIVTPEQFDLIYRSLPDASAQLLVETDIESGLRWGELSELRPRDLIVRTRTLTVSRAVVYVNPQFHPEGRRFLIKQYPKDQEPRRFKLSAQIVNKLSAHIDAAGLEPNDLLFPMRQDGAARPRKVRIASDPDGLGLTEPNAAGRRYRHATLTGYSLGKCRCEYCKDAYAIYRAERRIAGKDDPRMPRMCDTDGHIPRAWFRRNVWQPALAAAEIGLKVRVHDLRHAHASWLIAGGADLQVVKERLGHGSIRTTERYLHTLPDSDETALDALSRIRDRLRH